MKVEVTPIIIAQKFYGFESNVTPGTVLEFEYSSAFDRVLTQKPVTVINETPFHIFVDFGNFKATINKASIYCQDEVLNINP